MINLLNANVDDVIDAQTAVQWLNAGQNMMAAEARAEFTQLDASNSNSTFDFPAKYHEIPVLYACAMFQSSESSIAEKESYLRQFSEGLKTFIENYDVPMSFRDDANTEQFSGNGTKTTFTITKRGYTIYSDLKVYVNNVETKDFITSENDFILYKAPSSGSKITAIWVDRPEAIDPPYPWMKAW